MHVPAKRIPIIHHKPRPVIFDCKEHVVMKKEKKTSSPNYNTGKSRDVSVVPRCRLALLKESAEIIKAKLLESSTRFIVFKKYQVFFDKVLLVLVNLSKSRSAFVNQFLSQSMGA